MEKTISNASGIRYTFTDDGILCEAPNRALYFPYGSITKIKYGFLGFEIEGGGKTFFMATTGKMKAECKQMLAFAQSAMKTATPGEVEDRTEESKAKRLEEEEELMRELLGEDYGEESSSGMQYSYPD